MRARCHIHACSPGWPIAAESLKLFVLIGASVAGGCASLWNRAPVPESVTACRDLSQQALFAMEQNDWAAAERLLGRAVEVCPIDVTARGHYAEVLLRRGAVDEALTQLEESRALGNNDVSLTVRTGSVYLLSGRPERAAKLAADALNLDPTFADAWALRARVHLTQGDHAGALSDFQRALGLRPNDRGLQFELAALYARLHRPDRCLATVQSLLDNYPTGEEPAQALFLEGVALAELKRYRDAAHSMNLACSRGQPTLEMFQRLAETETRAGHEDRAEAVLAHILAHAPQYAPALALRQELSRRMASRQRDSRFSLGPTTATAGANGTPRF